MTKPRSSLGEILHEDSRGSASNGRGKVRKVVRQVGLVALRPRSLSWVERFLFRRVAGLCRFEELDECSPSFSGAEKGG